MALRALRGSEAGQEGMERGACPDPQVSRESLVCRDSRDFPETRGTAATREAPDPREQRGPGEWQEKTDLQEWPESLGRWDQEASLDLGVSTDSLAPLAYQAQKGVQDLRVTRDPLDLQGHPVSQELRDQLDLQALLVRWDLQARQDHGASLDFLDFQGLTACLVTTGTLGEPDQRETRGPRATQDQSGSLALGESREISGRGASRATRERRGRSVWRDRRVTWG